VIGQHFGCKDIRAGTANLQFCANKFERLFVRQIICAFRAGVSERDWHRNCVGESTVCPLSPRCKRSSMRSRGSPRGRSVPLPGTPHESEMKTPPRKASLLGHLRTILVVRPDAIFAQSPFDLRLQFGERQVDILPAHLKGEPHEVSPMRAARKILGNIICRCLTTPASADKGSTPNPILSWSFSCLRLK
jgi:hypothetical protein